jgi:hypothetical protein
VLSPLFCIGSSYINKSSLTVAHLIGFCIFLTRCSSEQIILDAVEQVGGIYLVTADHGNAEDMVKRNKSGKPLLDKNGGIQILTSHTLQPVSAMPFDAMSLVIS